MSSEEAVIATNDDASSCKRYAVHKGYWKDDFIQYFVKILPDRKAPEISRGYFARVEGIRRLIDQFLVKTDYKCQFVSIGAGFDTLFWRLQQSNLAPSYGYFEVDLQQVTRRKCYAIKSRRQLHAAFPNGGLGIEHDEAHSDTYHLLAGDIRNLKEMEDKLVGAGLNKNIPTLFMAECVLIYLDPSFSEALLQWIADSFSTCLFVNYEPVNLGDRFGQVMLENLQGRHCALLGAKASSSLDAQENRFMSTGWEFSKCRDMMDVYSRFSKEDIARIESIEFLDEVNLLYDLLRHYCISWGSRDAMSLGLSRIDF